MTKLSILFTVAVTLCASCAKTSGPGADGANGAAKPSQADCAKWSDQMVNLALAEGKKQGVEVDDAKKQTAKAEMDKMIPECQAELTVAMVECVLQATSVDGARKCDD